MKENQTRKRKTGNYITYKRIVDIGKIDSNGNIEVKLSCGHSRYLRDCGRDRIKLFNFKIDPNNAVLGCYKCGDLNKVKKS